MPNIWLSKFEASACPNKVDYFHTSNNIFKYGFQRRRVKNVDRYVRDIPTPTGYCAEP
jgi:hypothetical protein